MDDDKEEEGTQRGPHGLSKSKAGIQQRRRHPPSPTTVASHSTFLHHDKTYDDYNDFSDGIPNLSVPGSIPSIVRLSSPPSTPNSHVGPLLVLRHTRPPSQAASVDPEVPYLDLRAMTPVPKRPLTKEGGME
ncbi:hypothetical protein E1B28_006802 [Marasmius oreades]|uniref:Uncharacterized protein n=1 Tax=Marasmius oreades TaxID=181124 RepID=A0A9P7UWW3_9AGAR|nr:uncharacterized protein E1B28_006802 [Marasmius oreades]KAG7096128.1 hypothetical protein E1B28_006802 [Marasmius oreades]